MKKRRMMFIPEVNSKSFIFFFERGTGWSIRDYSVKNCVRERGPANSQWSADELHEKARYSLDAPTVRTDDLAFWHKYTNDCNGRYLGGAPVSAAVEAAPASAAAAPLAREADRTTQPTPDPVQSFPILYLDRLQHSPKGRKAQDMARILHSPNSEDWVTWNFFQILLDQYPAGWWGQLVSAARRRNPELGFPFDDRSLPTPAFWELVRSPLGYESLSRARMANSGNPEWMARARTPDPVEGASEIDITLDHEEFLIFIEAKLGSDVSMSTSHDPERNQIVRNIDCLMETAGDRMPFFWLLVKDGEPSRAYVQLVDAYKDDPGQLCKALPHRDPEALRTIARALTILEWRDFAELVCGDGSDQETNAVKRELERRILA